MRINKRLTTNLIITILVISIILAALPIARAEITVAPTLNPTSGPPGTRVTVSAGAGGASPFSTVTIYWDNLSGKVLNSTSADSTGAYEMEVTIPSAVNGIHWIVVNDGETESAGSQFNVTAGLVVLNYHLRVVPPIGNGEVYVDEILHTGDIVEFTPGKVANITAVPASGWTFDRWAFGHGGTSNPWYLTMTETMIAWAIFAEIPSEGNDDNTSFEVTTHNVTIETNTYLIEIFSNSNVSELIFNGTAIRFNVNGALGTTGFCNVTIPSELMSGDFSIYKDDTLLIKNIDYTRKYNSTHYFFNIEYEHSAHMIEILATEVIPEFPSWIILTLLLTTTLVVIIYKKRS